MAKQYVDMEAEGLSRTQPSFHGDIELYHEKYTVLSNFTLQLYTATKELINANEMFQSNKINNGSDPWLTALKYFASVLDSFQAGFALLLSRLKIIQKLKSLLASPEFVVQHNAMANGQLITITELCTILVNCIDIANFLLKL